MRHVFPTLALITVMGGCIPVETYYREGASLRALDRAEATCTAQALRQAPVSNVQRQGPPRYVPGPPICSTGGCVPGPGYYIPGPIYTVDLNLEPRQRIEGQCMADKGFARQSIPACPPRVAKAAPATPSATLPKLGPKACAIRRKDGSVQIVNQG